MKKLLTACILIIGIIVIGTSKIGAKMNTEITQVKASHILVETQSEAVDLKKQIENNEISFDDAAKKYSKCPSGNNGGDLGYFGRNMMVKEFENAAFNAEKNQVTDPVQTQFGWHLIKVTDKK